MAKDLASCIAQVKEKLPGDLLRIGHPVNPQEFEVTALVSAVAQDSLTRDTGAHSCRAYCVQDYNDGLPRPVGLPARTMSAACCRTGIG